MPAPAAPAPAKTTPEEDLIAIGLSPDDPTAEPALPDWASGDESQVTAPPPTDPEVDLLTVGAVDGDERKDIIKRHFLDDKTFSPKLAAAIRKKQLGEKANGDHLLSAFEDANKERVAEAAVDPDFDAEQHFQHFLHAPPMPEGSNLDPMMVAESEMDFAKEVNRYRTRNFGSGSSNKPGIDWGKIGRHVKEGAGDLWGLLGAARGAGYLEQDVYQGTKGLLNKGENSVSPEDEARGELARRELKGGLLRTGATIADMAIGGKRSVEKLFRDRSKMSDQEIDERFENDRKLGAELRERTADGRNLPTVGDQDPSTNQELEHQAGGPRKPWMNWLHIRSNPSGVGIEFGPEPKAHQESGSKSTQAEINEVGSNARMDDVSNLALFAALEPVFSNPATRATAAKSLQGAGWTAEQLGRLTPAATKILMHKLHLGTASAIAKGLYKLAAENVGGEAAEVTTNAAKAATDGVRKNILTEAGNELANPLRGPELPDGALRTAAKGLVKETATNVVGNAPFIALSENPEDAVAPMLGFALLGAAKAPFHGIHEAITRTQRNLGASNMLERIGSKVQYGLGQDDAHDAGMAMLSDQDKATVNRWRGFTNRLRPDGQPYQIYVLTPEDFQARFGADARGAAIKDGTAMYLNAGKASRGIDGTAGHEFGHGIDNAIADQMMPEIADSLRESMASALYDENGQPTPEFSDFVKGYSEKLRPGQGIAIDVTDPHNEAERKYMEGEFLAESTRNATSKKSLGDYAMPQTVQDRLNRGFQGFLKKWGIETPPDKMSEFNWTEAPTVTRHLEEILRGIGKDTLYDNGKPDPAISASTRVRQIDARLAEISATDEGQITPEVIAERQKLTKERDNLQGQLAQIKGGPAPAPAEANPQGPKPAAAAPQNSPDRVTVAQTLVALGIGQKEARQWAEVAEGDSVEEMVADALAARSEQRSPRQQPTVPAAAPAGSSAQASPLSAVEGALATKISNSSPLSSVEGEASTAVADAPSRTAQDTQTNESQTTSPNSRGETTVPSTEDNRVPADAPPATSVSSVPETDQVELARAAAPEGSPLRQSIDTLDANRGRVVWVRDYNSAERNQEGFSEAERSNELAEQDASKRKAGAKGTLQNKPFIPTEIRVNAKGEPYANGYDVDVMLSNLRHVADAMRDAGIENPLQNDKEVETALSTYVWNQMHGNDGAGLKPLEQPGGDYRMPKASEENPPRPLDPDPEKARRIADMLNMAANSKPYEVGTREADKGVAMAIENNGYRALSEVGVETNGLRDQLRGAGMDIDGTLSKRSAFYGRLSPELMKGGVTTEPITHGEGGKTVRPHGYDIDLRRAFEAGKPQFEAVVAGFMPDTPRLDPARAKAEIQKDDFNPSAAPTVDVLRLATMLVGKDELRKRVDKYIAEDTARGRAPKSEVAYAASVEMAARGIVGDAKYGTPETEGPLSKVYGKENNETGVEGEQPARSPSRPESDRPLAGVSEGENTQGAPPLAESQAARVTQTPTFKKWFGKSKVVDEQGQPKVMYHGTTKDFDSFDKSYDRGEGPIYYFTDNPKYAGNYAMDRGSSEGGRIMPVFLKAENLFDTTNPKHLKIYKDALRKDGAKAWEIKADLEDYFKDGLPHWENLAAIQIAKANGFDGIRVRERSNKVPIDSIGVFDPTQIKSASGNNGEFNSKNKDTRFMPDDGKPLEGVGEDSDTWYHGTAAPEDIKRFKVGDGELGRGVYVTKRPDMAGFWARGEGGRLYPLKVEGKIFETFGFDRKAAEKLAGEIKSEGKGKVAERWKDESVSDIADHIEKTWNQGDNQQRWLEAAGYVGLSRMNSQIPDQAMIFSGRKLKSAITGQRFMPDTGKDQPLRNVRSGDPDELGFYSNIGRIADEKLPNKGTGDQMLGIIRNAKGFKPEEAQVMGLQQFLEGKPSVTKAEVQEFINANKVQLREVRKADEVPAHVIKDVISDLGEIDPEELGIPNDEYDSHDHEKFTECIENAQTALEKGDVDTAIDELHSARRIEKTHNFSQGSALDDAIKSLDLNDRPQYGQWRPSGGQNYTENLLTLPSRDLQSARKDLGKPERVKVYGDPQALAQLKERGVTLKDPEKAEDVLIYPNGQHIVYRTDGKYQATSDRGVTHYSTSLSEAEEFAVFDHSTAKRKDFQGRHYSERNIIVHTRRGDHVLSDGSSARVVYEAQSDWHQQGRRKGYAGQDGTFDPAKWDITDAGQGVWKLKSKDGQFEQFVQAESKEAALKKASDQLAGTEVAVEQKVPDAPFKKTWHELAMKRELQSAVKDGKDSFVWLDGKSVGDMFGLDRRLDSLTYYQNTGGNYEIIGKKGSKSVIQTTVPANMIEGAVGKEIAEKIINGEGAETGGKRAGRMLSKEQLKTSHKGMKGFYDKMVPDFMRKYVEPWGGKIEPVEISKGFTGHRINITPEMREALGGDRPQPQFMPDTSKSDKPLAKVKSDFIPHGDPRRDRVNLMPDTAGWKAVEEHGSGEQDGKRYYSITRADGRPVTTAWGRSPEDAIRAASEIVEQNPHLQTAEDRQRFPLADVGDNEPVHDRSSAVESIKDLWSDREEPMPAEVYVSTSDLGGVEAVFGDREEALTYFNNDASRGEWLWRVPKAALTSKTSNEHTPTLEGGVARRQPRGADYSGTESVYGQAANPRGETQAEAGAAPVWTPFGERFAGQEGRVEMYGTKGAERGSADLSSPEQGALLMPDSDTKPLRNVRSDEDAPKKTKIRAASIRLKDGTVIEAPTHSFAYDKANEDGLSLAGVEEGFTTSDGRFLYRNEALHEAGGSTMEDIKNANKPLGKVTKEDRDLIDSLYDGLKEEEMTPEKAHRITVDRAKQEINEHFPADQHPDIKSWEDLQGVSDANMYVSDADRGADRIIGPMGKRLGWKNNEYVDFTNAMVEEIDQWLKDGRKDDASLMPDGKLPDNIKIKVERDNDDEGYWIEARDTTLKDAMGEPLAIAHLHIPDDSVRDNRFSAGDVYVSDDYRRKGIATAMYQAAQDHLERPATPGEIQSKDGEALWKGMRDKLTKKDFSLLPDTQPDDNGRIWGGWRRGRVAKGYVTNEGKVVVWPFSTENGWPMHQDIYKELEVPPKTVAARFDVNKDGRIELDPNDDLPAEKVGEIGNSILQSNSGFSMMPDEKPSSNAKPQKQPLSSVKAGVDRRKPRSKDDPAALLSTIHG